MHAHRLRMLKYICKTDARWFSSVRTVHDHKIAEINYKFIKYGYLPVQTSQYNSHQLHHHRKIP